MKDEQLMSIFRGTVKAGHLLLFFIITGMVTMSLPVFGENLLKDPSFEGIKTVTGNSSPWYVAAFNTGRDFSEFAIEKGNAHTGENYVRITNKKENHARVVQKVRVEPGKTYRLSCWAKADNVGTGIKGANITVENSIEYSPSISGTTTDWVYTEMYIKTGSGIDFIEIAVSLGGYYGTNTGTAFFDDITLEETHKIPRGAVTAVKGEIAEEEKKSPKDEIPVEEKQVRKVIDPKPVTIPVIIATILGILCGVLIIIRILYLNVVKKNKEDTGTVV